MIDDDDNLLAGLDLDAWAPPAPPIGLADRAIARANATDEAIEIVRKRRSKRRWWLTGGLAGALAAASVAVVAFPHHTPDPTSGALVADKAQQLAIAGVRANLDPGADLSWQHSGDAIHVALRAGSVSFSVEPAQQLSLDVGAAVASIDASNATFRVETRMNLTDTRVVGVTAATATAVALVTVIVYEGHIKLSGAGQTVVVARGTTMEISPGQPPHEVTNVAGVLPTILPVPPSPAAPATITPELIVPIGEKIVIHDPRGAIRVAVETGCPDQDKWMWPSGTATTTTVSDVSFTYTCHGIDKHGSIKVVKDPGYGVVMAPADGAQATDGVHVSGAAIPARKQVTVNGLIVESDNKQPWAIDVPYDDLIAIRIAGTLDEIDYYIRRLTPPRGPAPDVVIKAGDSVTVHDTSGSPRVQPTCDKLGKADNGRVFQYSVGSHPYTVTCNDGVSRTGMITVVADDGADIGDVTVRAMWNAPISRPGETAPGDRDVQAMQYEVPGKGTHVLLWRTDNPPNFGTTPAVDHVFRTLEPRMYACVKRPGPGQMVSLDVAVDGTTTHIRTTVDDPASDACLVDVLKTARFPKQATVRNVYFDLNPHCDAHALIQQGNALMVTKEYATALVKYDAAIDCKYDPHAIELGLFAACDAHNVKFARKYWKRMAGESKGPLLQICARNGITEQQLSE